MIGSTLGDAGPGIPSQLAAVTDVTGQLLPRTGLEPGRLQRGTGASLGVSRETLQQTASLAELQ